MNKNIFVALDTNLEKAIEIVNKTKDYAYGFKIGMTLFNQIGQEGLKKFDNLNIPLFLDLKFYDAPSQVSKTIITFKDFKNIEFMTVHSMSSKEMLKEAVQAAKKINDKLFICAVTVLTTTNNLEDIGIKNSLEYQVKLLVNLAKSCGVQGVISSAQNIKLIRSLAGENFKLICPGIREKNKEQNDQKQTVSYKQFNQLANKNTFCVIGRPIYAYGDPEENIKNIINS